MSADPGAGGDPELERISGRLEELAGELEADPEAERANELVREASKLAGEAGEELERMLNRLSGSQP